jgi:hypothetical protein
MFNVAYFSDLKHSSQPHREAVDVCIANISPEERQKRVRFGIMQLIVTLVVLALLIVLHVNPLWRLPLLFLFWVAAIGYFQARDKT